METIEIMVWFIFILVISLLFFAAFGNSKYSESSIEEYMEGLLNEEKINNCGLYTIPKRIHGIYIGSTQSVKIWECRECFSLWSDKTNLQMVS